MSGFLYRSCLLLGLLLLAGCGDSSTTSDRPTAPLEGTITFGGSNLTFGNLTVVSDDGQVSRTVRIEADGRYSIPDAPVGRVKAAISFPATQAPSRVMPKDVDKSTLPVGPKKSFDSEKLKKKDELASLAKSLPERYRDVDKSGLSFNVEAGNNRWDIQLAIK